MRDSAKKIIKISSLLFVFLFIITYGTFVSHNLIFGIKIKNLNIEDGTKYTENILKMTGKAENAVNLALNGREISVDEG